MIRDPTERFISEFYFRRRLQKEGVKNGERQWYDEVILFILQNSYTVVT